MSTKKADLDFAKKIAEKTAKSLHDDINEHYFPEGLEAGEAGLFCTIGCAVGCAAGCAAVGGGIASAVAGAGAAAAADAA